MNTEASDYSVTPHPRWMQRVLVAAGLYNLLWGAFVISFPTALFTIAAIPVPLYPQIWQCVGMIVGVYGIGYLISAADPVRHWPIVLVGFLGKTLGPIGFLASAIQGNLPWAWGLTIITNDLIWWLPFAGILYHSLRHHTNTSNPEKPNLAELIRTFASQRGVTLDDLSRQKPTLVVFLRHAGCTFCRETLADLAEKRELIENTGVELAVVHMSEPTEAEPMFARYQLGDVHRFSDPRCDVYRAFGLQRGKFQQLFGPAVWRRAIQAFLRGFGIGRLAGDGFRMPGAFVLHQGQVVEACYSSTVADRPDYIEIARRHGSDQEPFQTCVLEATT